MVHARANTNDGRAMLRYVSRRREPVRERDGSAREERRTLGAVAGDERRFLEALEWREKKGREVAYMSVVISPERRDVGLPDEDWRRIVRLWSTNRNGREEGHVAYVHRDTEHEHMHLAVARSYYSSAELERITEQTRQIVRERERERDQARVLERVYGEDRDRQRVPGRPHGREPERSGPDRGEREPGLEREDPD